MRSYELAKARDTRGLENELAGRCVDEWLPGRYFFSAISLLAAENDHEGVAIMLAFGASIHYEVVGAAFGGYESHANALVARGAALNCAVYGAALGDHESYVEAILAQGASLDWAVWGAAQGGYESYANALIARGASLTSLNCAVSGAALGGYESYANALIARGASLDYAVRGAAEGGYESYANTLIARGASLNQAIWGAARGGYESYANALIARGASLHWAVWATAQGGRYTNALLARGASLNWAVHGASQCFHLQPNNPTNQLRYLSSYEAKYVSPLAKACAKLPTPIVIPPPIIRQATHCSRLRQTGFSFAAARIATVRDANNELMNRGAIIMAVSIFLDHRSQSPYLNLFKFPSKDIWSLILNEAVGFSLSQAEWEALALAVAKTQVSAVLTDYARLFSKGKHKDRAVSFNAALLQTNTVTDFQTLLLEQSALLSNPNQTPGGPHKYQQPLRNKTEDGYHLLVHRWANRFMEAETVEEFEGFQVMRIK